MTRMTIYDINFMTKKERLGIHRARMEYDAYVRTVHVSFAIDTKPMRLRSTKKMRGACVTV